ncbi:MAG: hypothetical protein HY438_04010 [DPANN group archaeon]|nr:hypothetical protein [DPANN group archaeon]
MKFSDFIERGQAKKAEKDISMVKSLIANSATDLTFLKTLQIGENSARRVMACYYDVLRSLVEAMALLDGYKVYSHEAFTYYLKDMGEGLLAEKFDRFRKIRNGINYYGKTISIAEVSENIKDILKIISMIKTKYLPAL